MKRTLARHFTRQFRLTELKILAVRGVAFNWGPFVAVAVVVVVEGNKEGEREGEMRRPGASSWIWLLMRWQFGRQVWRVHFCRWG